EDVLQETWLAAYTHLETLADPAAAKAWLLAIAKNQCALWYRQRYRREEREAAAHMPVPESGSAGVESLLAGLPCETARILQLYYIQGYRQKEIAARLGIPAGTVKSRLHYARERLRQSCQVPPTDRKKGQKRMKNGSTNEHTHGFPPELPEITIEKLPDPYVPVRSVEENFIIPRIGETNSEGTYRYPAGRLTCVSTCRVPKAACIHEVDGVKVVRDTYNVRAEKLYRNEKIWFSQMTEEYIRELGFLDGLEEDDEYPTYLTTFLDEGFNDIVNAEDPARGMPVLVRENPIAAGEDGYRMEKYNIRYTLGMYRLIVGQRTFRAAGILRVFYRSCTATVSFVSPEGRMLLLRWYETEESIRNCDNYPDSWIETIAGNEVLTVNGVRYIHTEDRLGEIVL
ncbi:MAG: sigma-70 family RNA polymerase sigma factor, partial [Clostridia bacterium]|nr:sigma-70 family RNA polymerase sigma factor [Clostridia bacterium]